MQSLPVEMQFKLLNIPYNNYKTQKCKFFEKDGMCRFGKNCSYAHGPEDLRKPYEDLPEETVEQVTKELADKNAVILAIKSAHAQTTQSLNPFVSTSKTPVQYVPPQFQQMGDKSTYDYQLSKSVWQPSSEQQVPNTFPLSVTALEVQQLQ